MSITRRALVRNGLLTLGAMALTTLPRRAHGATSYVAARARADLLPATSSSPIFINGFGYGGSLYNPNSKPHPGMFEGIYDPARPPLSARALALQNLDGGDAVVLVSLDLAGIAPDLHDRIADSVSDLLPRANLALCCSHTHAGPLAELPFGLIKYPAMASDPTAPMLVREYETYLLNVISTLIRNAVTDLVLKPREVTLHHGVGEVDLAINRIGGTFGDVDYNYLTPNPDSSVPVLVALDTALAAPFAIVFGYTAHPLSSMCPFGGSECAWTWEQEMHSDYPGVAAEILERNGALALFVQGCAGDQQMRGDFPPPGAPGPSHVMLDARGRELAAEVERVLREIIAPERLAETAVTGPITAAERAVKLPFDIGQSLIERRPDDTDGDRVAVIELTELEDIYRRLAGEASGPGGGHVRQHALRMISPTNPIPTSQPWHHITWYFDGPSPFLFYGLEGEVVASYRKLITGRFHGRARTWVAAYVNRTASYIPDSTIVAAPASEAIRARFRTETGGSGSDMMTYTAGWDWLDRWTGAAGVRPTLYRPLGSEFSVDVRTVLAAGNLGYYGQPCRYRVGLDNIIARSTWAVGETLIARSRGCS